MLNGNLRMFDIGGRTLGLFGTLDTETCLAACEAILRLRAVRTRLPIHLYLGCAGGDPKYVFMIIDCLRARRGRLTTYLMSQVGTMGLLLLAEGDKRLALPHGFVMAEGLKPHGGVGFNQTKPESANRDTDSMIHDHLTQRLGLQATKELLGLGEIDLAKAFEHGLVHKVITSQKTQQYKLPTRHYPRI
jgi:ATP-dependent protease ClpP protease subunit